MVFQVKTILHTSPIHHLKTQECFFFQLCVWGSGKTQNTSNIMLSCSLWEKGFCLSDLTNKNKSPETDLSMVSLIYSETRE